MSTSTPNSAGARTDLVFFGEATRDRSSEVLIPRDEQLLSSYGIFSDDFLLACHNYRINSDKASGILTVRDMEEALIHWGFAEGSVTTLVNSFLVSNVAYQRSGRPSSIAREIAAKLNVPQNRIYRDNSFDLALPIEPVKRYAEPVPSRLLFEGPTRKQRIALPSSKSPGAQATPLDPNVLEGIKLGKLAVKLQKTREDLNQSGKTTPHPDDKLRTAERPEPDVAGQSGTPGPC